MWALLGSVFLASLAGSGHCAGMCGAFAAACSGCDGRRGAPVRPARGARRDPCLEPDARRERARSGRWRGAMAYHAARGASYMAAGAIVGGIGATLDLGGSMIGVQRFAAILAGATVVLVGVATLLRLRGLPVQATMPGALTRAVGAAHQWASRSSLVTRSVTLGTLSALLPCGWLWAFLAVAAGAGSPAAGVAVMAAFWAGTVPVLALIGGGVGRVAAIWRGRVAVATALAMIVVGIHTVATAGARSNLLAHFDLRPASDLAGASLRVAEASNELPPCCRGDDDGEKDANSEPSAPSSPGRSGSAP